MEKKNPRLIILLLVLAAAILPYLWLALVLDFVQGTTLLNGHEGNRDILDRILRQTILILPQILIVLGGYLKEGEAFDYKVGLNIAKRVKVTLTPFILYVLLLPVVTARFHNPKLAVYGWFYYLVFIAGFEEAIFRGLIPSLLKDNGFPRWVEWLLPALLFSAVHLTLPLATGTVTEDTFIQLGVTFCYHFLFYGLRVYSGAVYLGISIHALVDLLQAIPL